MVLVERIGTHALETAQQLDEAKVRGGTARSEAKDQADGLRSDAGKRKQELEEKQNELIERIKKSRYFGMGRMLRRAFPDMQHKEHSELLDLLRKSMNQ